LKTARVTEWGNSLIQEVTAKLSKISQTKRRSYWYNVEKKYKTGVSYTKGFTPPSGKASSLLTASHNPG
jgi:hypothetical protein